MGGQGNRMFQIAACYGIAKRNNTTYSIPHWNDLVFFAGNFNISNEISINQYNENGFHYQEINGQDLHLHGYFQSKKYWQHCEQDIRELFKPCESIKKYLDEKYGFLEYDEDSCAIHVRGGDYLNLKDYHYNLGIDYYQRAINYLYDRDDYKNFYIFTDDIKHAKSLFGEKENYVQTGKAHLDFFLMQRCKSFIIANSSFSWCAAVLSGSKEIIAPKSWFGKLKQDLITDDLYTKEMKVI